MTVIQLVIVPGVLFAAFLTAVLLVTARLVNARVRESAARRRLSEKTCLFWQVAHERLGLLSRKQGDVIAAVIGELEAHPASYEAFPESLRGELFAAHESATQLEKNPR